MLTVKNTKCKVFSSLNEEDSRENNEKAIKFAYYWNLSTYIVTRTYRAMPIIDRIVRMIVNVIVYARSVRAKLRSKILPRAVIALTHSSSADNKAADCEIKLNLARAGFDHLIQPKGAVSPREFHANEFIAWLYVFLFMHSNLPNWLNNNCQWLY